MIHHRYRPDIDGLRAVAVLLVVCFHANLVFSGGYVGVDVFFVVSGFLITGLISKQQRDNNFSLLEFWGRRIRRIIPAASVAAAATLAVGCVLLLPEDLVELTKSAISQQLMLSNVYFWRSTSYFGGPAETKALLHTWSLAVEEQFYLGFPFLLIFCNRLSRRFTCVILIGLAIASFSLSEWGARYHPTATFFLLPTRMWELLLGAILVFFPEPIRWKTAWLEICAWTGIASIFIAGWTFDSFTRFPGATALLPCLGAALIIYSSSFKQTSLGLILSHKYLVFIGLISYSLYLWHWPIFSFLHYWLGHELALSVRMAAILASLLCGYASWRFVEKPFRQNFSAVSIKKTTLTAFATATALVVLSLAINYTNGLAWRLPGNAKQLFAKLDAHQPVLWSIRQINEGILPSLGEERDPTKPIDFIVWGDSHAEALGELFDSLGKENGLSGVIASRHSTVPLLGVGRPPYEKTFNWNDSVLKYIQDENISNVILVSKWASYIERPSNGRTDTLISDEQSLRIDPEEAKAAFKRGQERTLAELAKTGTRVWIVKQVPLQSYNPKLETVRAELLGKNLPPGVSISTHRKKQLNVNTIIDFVADKHACAQVLDPSKYCFDKLGFSQVWSNEGLLYSDDNHLSPLGADRLLSPLVELVFRELQQKPAF